MRVVSPTLARTSSPGDTIADGLAGRPFTRTCPPRHAEAASGRVFARRTAHSHRSTRVDSMSTFWTANRPQACRWVSRKVSNASKVGAGSAPVSVAPSRVCFTTRPAEWFASNR